MGKSWGKSSENSASREEGNGDCQTTSIPPPPQQRQQGTVAHVPSDNDAAIRIKQECEELNCTARDFAEVAGICIQLPAALPSPTPKEPVEPGAYRVNGLPSFHHPQNLQARGHPQGSSNQNQTTFNSEWTTRETHAERRSRSAVEGQECLDDMELARAWPVSLDIGVAQEEPVTRKSRGNSQSLRDTSSWTLRKSIALSGLCLLVCAATVLALIFLRIQISLSDPAEPRHKHVKAAIEQVFGQDYFDAEPKEKALHWIVYNDPLQHLAAKQDHEEAVSSLIQRFLLVAFYFQTSAQQPWNYCNPPKGRETDLCYYQNPGSPTGWLTHATRWLTATHECRWMGVECEGGSERVSAVRIPGNNMTGHIPSELSRLTHTKQLDLRNNQLSGSLPLWMDQLSSLETLRLSQNILTGSLPSSYFLMPSLEILNLGNNLMTGTIPLHNGFHGGPPLDSTTSLGMNALGLQGNLMTGTVPVQLYSMSQLQYLLLWENNFNGTIAHEISNLEKLRELWLEDNQLMSGSIPPEVGFLKHLRCLNLQNSNITGTIPATLFSLGQSRKLSLRDTKISGTISTRIGLLTNLQELDIAGTNLSGTIPEEISKLSGLVELYANGNVNLTGSMPAKFCSNRLQGDKTKLASIIADCTPLSSSGIPVMECPGHCCTVCCDSETKICKEQ